MSNLLALLGKLLSVLAPLTEPLALEVEHVDWNAQQSANATGDPDCCRQLVLGTGEDLAIEWARVQRRNASQQVATEAVTARGGGGVRAVCGNHVVDRSHVDGEVGDADECCKEQGQHPVHLWWTVGAEAEADKPYWLEHDEEQEEPEAAFWGEGFGVFAEDFSIAPVDGQESEVGNQVTD